MLTIVGACVVCTIYRDACSLCSTVKYFLTLGPAVCKKHIPLSCRSSIEVHAATVAVVQTVDRCTRLGSYGVNCEGNTFVDPASVRKHRNFIRVDGVYMLAGLTIHTVCRNCCGSIAFVYSPRAICILNRRDLAKDVNLCIYALEGTFDIFCDIYCLSSCSLCEVVCRIEVLANQDCVQCVCSILYGSEYIIALLVSDLICGLLPEVGNAVSKSNLRICSSAIYKGIRTVSYLRNNKSSRQSIVIVCLLSRAENQIFNTLNMVCTIYCAIVCSLIPFRTDVVNMSKNDGRRCRSCNLYILTRMELVQSIDCSCVGRSTAENCNACFCKLRNFLKFFFVIVVNDILCAING